ncbi:hypothetical protein BJ742DRAFT_485196 [Cladochytrium replicatum]|nr:hypothetical protein BJ742DRAFT_485196 [Cladochytrium replicatum]
MLLANVLAALLAVFTLTAAGTPEENGVDFHGCKSPNTLALTFDDGPHPTVTPAILDVLKELGIKTTFFVMGKNVHNNTAILKRAYDEGHQIAQHTYDHFPLTRLSDDEVRDQIKRNEDLVYNVIGQRMRVMRPPYGNSDRRVHKILKGMGYWSILWTLDTNDWRGYDPMDTFEKGVEPGRGIASLSHDTAAVETPKKLQEIHAYVKSKGFRFISISECIDKQPYEDGWGNVVNAAFDLSVATNTTESPRNPTDAAVSVSQASNDASSVSAKVPSSSAASHSSSVSSDIALSTTLSPATSTPIAPQSDPEPSSTTPTIPSSIHVPPPSAPHTTSKAVPVSSSVVYSVHWASTPSPHPSPQSPTTTISIPTPNHNNNVTPPGRISGEIGSIARALPPVQLLSFCVYTKENWKNRDANYFRNPRGLSTYVIFGPLLFFVVLLLQAFVFLLSSAQAMCRAANLFSFFSQRINPALLSYRSW